MLGAPTFANACTPSALATVGRPREGRSLSVQLLIKPRNAFGVTGVRAPLPMSPPQVYPAEMSSPRIPAVQSDPQIMSGTVVFAGTRVPFQTLIDYIEAGQPLSEFLEDFPTVSSEQAIAALEEAKEALLTIARPA